MKVMSPWIDPGSPWELCMLVLIGGGWRGEVNGPAMGDGSGGGGVGGGSGGGCQPASARGIDAIPGAPGHVHI